MLLRCSIRKVFNTFLRITAIKAEVFTENYNNISRPFESQVKGSYACLVLYHSALMSVSTIFHIEKNLPLKLTIARSKIEICSENIFVLSVCDNFFF